MSLDSKRLIVFFGSGIAYLVIFFAVFRGLTVVLGAVVFCFVGIGSLLLASRAGRTGPKLTGLWLAAVAALAAVAGGTGAGIFLSLFAGILFGTLLFGLWVGSGLLLLQAFPGGKR